MKTSFLFAIMGLLIGALGTASVLRSGGHEAAVPIAVDSASLKSLNSIEQRLQSIETGLHSMNGSDRQLIAADQGGTVLDAAALDRIADRILAHLEASSQNIAILSGEQVKETGQISQAKEISPALREELDLQALMGSKEFRDLAANQRAMLLTEIAQKVNTGQVDIDTVLPSHP